MNTRAYVVPILIAGALAPTIAAADDPKESLSIPARKYSGDLRGMKLRNVVAELNRQTGMEIDLHQVDGDKLVGSKSLDHLRDAEFWTVAERLAESSGNRIVVGTWTKPVRFEKFEGVNRPPVAITGPFRVEARRVEARRDAQTGKIAYDLHLDVAWEPRLPVYRIDSCPTIVRARDNLGGSIRGVSFDSRIPAIGAGTSISVRLEGFADKSRQIVDLRGRFEVTLAEEMLQFTFDDLVGAFQQQGVTVELSKFEKSGYNWIADVELVYPDEGAVFESFETDWLSRNTMTLVSPDGLTRFEASSLFNNGTSRRYRFQNVGRRSMADFRGWRIEYQTPGVLRDQIVDFELKGIRLP